MTAYRARDPLEDYSLESLTMVGSLQLDNVRWALIRSKDGIVHRRSLSDYMGKNNGRILKVTEDSVELQELISQSSFGCIKRTTVLHLKNGPS